MVDRLRSYAQAIADDQDVTVEAVLESMRTALADLTHRTGCSFCSVLAEDWHSPEDAADDQPCQPPPDVMVRIAPQDVTNA